MAISSEGNAARRSRPEPSIKESHRTQNTGPRREDERRRTCSSQTLSCCHPNTESRLHRNSSGAHRVEEKDDADYSAEISDEYPFPISFDFQGVEAYSNRIHFQGLCSNSDAWHERTIFSMARKALSYCITASFHRDRSRTSRTIWRRFDTTGRRAEKRKTIILTPK